MVQFSAYLSKNFTVDGSGDELVIIHNSGMRDAMWVSYLNNSLEYNGNYSGILRRYPYLHDHIEYM